MYEFIVWRLDNHALAADSYPLRLKSTVGRQNLPRRSSRENYWPYWWDELGINCSVLPADQRGDQGTIGWSSLC